MTWQHPNDLGDDVSPVWASETRAAITIKDGIITSNGPTGVVITLPSAVGSVDDYMVFMEWQEDPGPYAGERSVAKTLNNFTIKTSGSLIGKKLAYRVSMKVTLP